MSEPPAGEGRPIVVVGNVPLPLGGVEERCFQVASRLTEAGAEVHFLDTEPSSEKWVPPVASYAIVTGRYGSAVPKLLANPRLVATNVRLLAGVARTIGPRGMAQVLLVAARIAATVRQSGSRLVVAHHAGNRGLAALVAARATGARLTLFVHGSEWSPPRAGGLPVARVVTRSADRVIANSEHTRRICREATGRDDVDVVYPGLDHDQFNPSRRPAPGERAELRVACVGRLTELKGTAVLAEAIPLVRAGRPVRYEFVGPDGGAEARARELLRAAGVEDHVVFRGALRHEDLPAVYGSADVLAFPTLHPMEGFGLVSAEAMACGTPVVASRVGAVPEVVLDGETGLLFTAGDAGELAAALGRLLGDDELRLRMGRAAAAHAATFTWSSIVAALLADLEEVHADPVGRVSRRRRTPGSWTGP